MAASPSPLVSARKYAYDIQGVGGVARTLDPLRPLSGSSNNSAPILPETNLDDAAFLAERQRLRQIQEEDRLRQIEQERAFVRDTLSEARARIAREDQLRKAKMDEQMHFLQESERLSLAHLQHERELEALDEQRAKSYLDILESRRRRQLEADQELRTLREARMARVGAKMEQEQQAVEDFQSSAIHEAARRLLKAHASEIDFVEPVLREILSEPEFSPTPLERYNPRF